MVNEKRYALRTDIDTAAVIEMLHERCHNTRHHDTQPCDDAVETIGSYLDELADATEREKWLIATLTSSLAYIATADKRYHTVTADEIISDATDIACVNGNFLIAHDITINE